MPDEIAPTGWDDLAINRAGQGVDAQAKALRSKAPVRTLFARVLGVHTDERAFRVGAKGERLVGQQLDRLPPPWHMLHSITLSESGTDLDHLVIGPAGVFSVNTKYHPDANVWVAGGTFLVNGQRQDYVRASRAEGRKVARLLTRACGFEVEVTPVIAVVGAADGFKVKEQPAGVVVCTRRRIVDWLRSQPPKLGSGTVEAIYSVGRLRSTWAWSGPEGTPSRQSACPSSEETKASVTNEFAQAAPGRRTAEDRGQLFGCPGPPCAWRPKAP